MGKKKEAKEKSKRSENANANANAFQEISEAEQWRLVKESGIIERAKESDDEPPLDMADEVFNAILFIIPVSFLYLMMDILIHKQYGKHPSPRDYAGRLLPAIPVLSVFIYYTNTHKQKRSMQVSLFFASIAAGTRLIWLVNRAPWHIIIRQGPPLATIWIYTIAILNLLPAVTGLALVAAWVRFSGMSLFF